MVVAFGCFVVAVCGGGFWAVCGGLWQRCGFWGGLW